jgi:predicted permease
MELLTSTFGSVAVLLGMGTLGFWIISKRIMPEQALGALSPLALDIAMPSLVFASIISNFSPKESPDWWHLPLYWVGFAAVAAVLTAASMLTARKEVRREFGISLFYQNGLFFPLAILTGLYPGQASYLVYLFLFMLFYPAFFFNTYRVFFRKKGAPVDWHRFLNPVLIASFLAIGIRLFDLQIYIPDFVIRIFKLLGGMTIPLVMIILGGSIYVDFQEKGTLYWGEVAKFVLIKNIAFPLVFLALLVITRPGYSLALIVLLESAVPPVTAVPILTKRAGGNPSIVNQFVIASFIASLVSIPVMVMIFGMVFGE